MLWYRGQERSERAEPGKEQIVSGGRPGLAALAISGEAGDLRCGAPEDAVQRPGEWREWEGTDVQATGRYEGRVSADWWPGRLIYPEF